MIPFKISWATVAGVQDGWKSFHNSLTSNWNWNDMVRPCVLDAWLAAQCMGEEGTSSRDLAAAVLEEQCVRLRRVLRHALRRGRFYRERLSACFASGFVPEDMSPAGLPSLPFTTAEDLADWKQFLCVSQDAVERVVTLETSGTTGLAKRLAFSRKDLEATMDFFRVGMSQLVHAGERALVLWPGAARPHGVSSLLREALGNGGVEAFAGEPLANTESLARELAAYNPHVVVAAPRQLVPLADLLSRGFPGQDVPLALRGILSSAESLPSGLADTLQKNCGLLVLEHYGLTETGYGGGVECPAHHGLHLRELDLLVEIVDPLSGEALPDGREGEVVVTTLTREAMPLIRYRTGDYASMLPGPCRCGSPLRRLGPIRGRIVYQGAAYSVEQPVKGAFCEKSACLAL